MAQWLSWLERRPVTAEVEGSSPFWVVYFYGILAQLGEHLPYKQRVIGSSPIGPIDLGGFPSGQRGQTVNLLAPPSKVRILLHPLRSRKESRNIYGPKPKRFESFSIHQPQWRNWQTHRT